MTKQGRPANIAIILTARSHSRRLPSKNIADVGGKPLLSWVAARLQEIGNVIIETPKGDQAILDVAHSLQIPAYEGSPTDVTGSILDAVERYAKDTRYVMRGLGDCPFIVPQFAKHARDVLAEQDADAMCWMLPPFTYTMYGATEFPRSRAAWERINADAVNDEREHPDLYFHRHRDRFTIVYHEPPGPIYFRPYRLEVDWKEDLELVRRLVKEFGYLPTMEEAVTYLDASNMWKVNRNRVERTGLTASYAQRDRTLWWSLMQGQPIVMWDDTIWKLPTGGEPVYCRNKTCLLGYAKNGDIHTPTAVIPGPAYLKCPCGSGRHWAAKS